MTCLKNKMKVQLNFVQKAFVNVFALRMASFFLTWKWIMMLLHHVMTWQRRTWWLRASVVPLNDTLSLWWWRSMRARRARNMK